MDSRILKNVNTNSSFACVQSFSTDGHRQNFS
jgi:hypothetical protein